MAMAKQCAHEPCTCNARESSMYCSSECENAAKQSSPECSCGHKGCKASSQRAERHQSAGQR